MPSVFTLEGTTVSKSKRGLGNTATPNIGDRKCVFNPRTKQWRPMEYQTRAGSPAPAASASDDISLNGALGRRGKRKRKRHPGRSNSGWIFVKGTCKP